jgi:hypothetical protein
MLQATTTMTSKRRSRAVNGKWERPHLHALAVGSQGSAVEHTNWDSGTTLPRLANDLNFDRDAAELAEEEPSCVLRVERQVRFRVSAKPQSHTARHLREVVVPGRQALLPKRKINERCILHCADKGDDHTAVSSGKDR